MTAPDAAPRSRDGTADPREPGDVGSPRRRKPSRSGGTARLTAALISPTLLVLGVVVIYPILAALYQSMFVTAKNLDAQGFVVESDRFVGLGTFANVLFGPAADRFWTAFWNTTFFTVTTVALEAVLGMAMALVMHQAIRGRALVRASVLVPWAIPTAVSALLWRWIFAPDGVANAMLGQQVLWSSNGIASKFAVIIAEVWKTAPFVGLLVLAGLQIISREVHDSATVDGAGALRRFWHITLPLVKPALVVAVLFRMLDAMRMFDLPFILIGQQKDSVETLSMLAFAEATNVHYGPAAAYATLTFAYVALIAFVFVKVLGADVLGETRAHNGKANKTRPRSNDAGKAVA